MITSANLLFVCFFVCVAINLLTIYHHSGTSAIHFARPNSVVIFLHLVIAIGQNWTSRCNNLVNNANQMDFPHDVPVIFNGRVETQLQWPLQPDRPWDRSFARVAYTRYLGRAMRLNQRAGRNDEFVSSTSESLHEG